MAEYDKYTPPLGFHFKVKLKEPVLEFSFQSVSGLTKEVVTESIREGGQEYDYALPVKFQYPDLILKRGLWVPEATKAGLLESQGWLYGLLQEFKVHASDIEISLLKPNGEPCMTWEIRRAWPKKWVIADFNAEENQVLIETIELRYDSFDVAVLNPGPATQPSAQPA